MTTRTLTDTATITQDVGTAGQLKLNVPGLAIPTGKSLVTGDNSDTSAVAIGVSSVASDNFTISIGREAVASAGAAIAIGWQCTTSSNSSQGIGDGVSNTGYFSIAAGGNATIDRDYGTSLGYASSVHGSNGVAIGAFADTRYVSRAALAMGNPKLQRYTQFLDGQTTGSTPKALTFGGGSAIDTNQNTLANNSCQSFRGRVIGFTSNSAAACGFEFSGLIRRTANAASTALVSAVTPVAIGTPDAALATATVAVTADTTYGALAVTVTGVAATTINWICVIDSELRVT